MSAAPAQQRRIEKIRFGLYEVNLQHEQLFRNGSKIRLEPQAFKVLVMLLRRADETVTHAEIIKAIWPLQNEGFEEYFDENLKQAIKKIRAALIDSPKNPHYIQTVFGEGYKFLGPVDFVSARPAETGPSELKGEGSGESAIGAEPIAQSSQLTNGHSQIDHRPTQSKADDATTDLSLRPRVSHLKTNASSTLATYLQSRWLLVAASIFLVAILVATSLISKRVIPTVTKITQITNDGKPKPPWIAIGANQVFFSGEAHGAIGLFQAEFSGASGGEIAEAVKGRGPIPLDTKNDELLIGSTSGLTVWSVLFNRGRHIGPFRCDFAKWSPDGAQIACAVDGDLHLFRSDGSNDRVLQRLKAIHGLAWNLNGKEIRYSGQTDLGEPAQVRSFNIKDGTDREVSSQIRNFVIGKFLRENLSIYVSGDDHQIYVSGEKSKPVALTRGPTLFYSVLTDPAERTAFAMGQTELGELVRFDGAGKLWSSFLDGLSADCLTWSADGAQLAYVTYPQEELWQSKADGTGAVQLTARPMRVYHPNWSPDGRKIAYETISDSGVGRIFTIDRNGGVPQELTAGFQLGWNQRDPSWSPDGTHIAVQANSKTGEEVALFSVDIQTGRPAKLPNSDGLSSPRWSPDQSSLLALTSRDHRIVVYDLRSQKIERILTSPGMGWPHWSRKGERVCFLEGRLAKIGCIAREGGVIQDVASIPFGLTGNTFSRYWDHNIYAGFTPEDEPIALRDRDRTELYSLALDW